MWVVLIRATYRQVETLLAGTFTHSVTPGQALINRHADTIFLNLHTTRVFGLVVTPECSSAIVTAAVLGLAALTISFTRFRLRRVLLAAGAAAGLFALINLLRLVMIAFATDHWGLTSGYRWSHLWAGSFVTVFGGITAATAYIVVLGATRSRSGTAD